MSHAPTGLQALVKTYSTAGVTDSEGNLRTWIAGYMPGIMMSEYRQAVCGHGPGGVKQFSEFASCARAERKRCLTLNFSRSLGDRS